MAALNSKVRKAVIPVAGLGTRMLPATKAIPKEMLPLVDKPLIQYVVNECIAAGITEIVLVTHSSKNSIENHFDTSSRFDETGASQIMVEPVEDVTAYGVVDCKGESLKPGESVPMVGVVEKPKADVAPSNLAVVGRYVLSADIWPLLAKTPPGAGDEIQLTDAIDMLIEKETVEAYHMKGKSHDCGNKLGYMQAFVEYGIRHKTLGDDFKAWLETAVTK